jgi:glycine oxidase
MKTKFCIIGGGLAGTMLAARLCIENQQVIIIDDENSNSASKVAAGMFNIVTGKNALKTWMADELLAEMKAFFEISSFKILSQYLHYQPIYRPFKEISDYNAWTLRKFDENYLPYITFQEKPILTEYIHNPLGGIFIEKCGWLEIGKFVTHLQQILRREFGLTYFAAKIEDLQTQLDLKNRNLHLESQDSIDFEQLIFCQGAAVTQNPFWKIPVIPNKGEILLIHAPELQLEYIISGKVYLIPVGNQHFVAGATYEWSFENPFPSEKAKAELCEYLDNLLHVPYKIVNHRAGLRPTTRDRRPILATHPEMDFLHTFTGFGTKGVILSPYFSKVMAEKLLE